MMLGASIINLEHISLFTIIIVEFGQMNAS